MIYSKKRVNRIEHEKRIVRRMIEIYCQERLGLETPSAEYQELMAYCDAREDSRRDVLGWSAHVALRSGRSNSTPLGAINKRGGPIGQPLFVEFV